MLNLNIDWGLAITKMGNINKLLKHFLKRFVQAVTRIIDICQSSGIHLSPQDLNEWTSHKLGALELIANDDEKEDGDVVEHDGEEEEGEEDDTD